MTIYGLDPGTRESALVMLPEDGGVFKGTYFNQSVLLLLQGEWMEGGLRPGGHVVIEQIESYGMAVGREVFETVFWAGRFAQACESKPGRGWSMLPRRDVKLHLCGSMKAKDANIRQALIDRYGGKAATKKGGPLYGISSHMWSALALAVTYQEQQETAVGV